MSREAVKVGDKAPDFELYRPDGGVFRLYDALKEHAVVLYFYPKDNTSGCTRQACEFRDQYEVFREYGAKIVGISGDSTESHRVFGESHQLPFTLLSDKGGTVRSLFRVPKKFGFIPGRVTYVIDKNGIVQYIFNSLTKPLEHVRKAIEVLQRLQQEEKLKAKPKKEKIKKEKVTF